MKTLEDATLEEILHDVTGSECIDQAMMVMSNHPDGVFVCDYEGRDETTAPTLREALIQIKSKTVAKYGWAEDLEEFHLIDWSRFAPKES